MTKMDMVSVGADVCGVIAVEEIKRKNIILLNDFGEVCFDNGSGAKLQTMAKARSEEQ